MNFKVHEASTYRPVNNDLKIFVCVFNTSVKEVKQSSTKYPKYHFKLIYLII
jgi:hypothetical protein